MNDSEPLPRTGTGTGTGAVPEPGTATAPSPVTVSAQIPTITRPPALPLWDRIWSRLTCNTRWGIGSVFRWLGVPGAIADMSYDDQITGQRVSVKVRHFDTRVTVGQRHYFFSRLGGKFNGTGYSLCSSRKEG